MKSAERKKMEEAKARARKIAAKKAEEKESRTRGEIGEFGYGVNTKVHKFLAAIKAKPQTMKQIINAKWNKDKANFYGYLPGLLKAGVIEVSDKKVISLATKKAPVKKLTDPATKAKKKKATTKKKKATTKKVAKKKKK